MPDYLALQELPARGRPPEHAVALRGGTVVTWREFMHSIGAWREALAMRPGADWALYVDDSLDFAAGLLGAWCAGKRVFLPNDNRPGTCAALSYEVDGFLGEFPAQYAPLIAPEAGGDRAFAPLHPEDTRLVIYTSGSTGAPVAIEKRLKQLMAEIATLQELWGAALAGSTVLATVSHQHIYGLLFKVLWPLCAGRAFDAPRLEYPESVVSRVLALPRAALIASPAMLKRLPDQLPWQKVGRGLGAIFSSGGPLPVEAAQHVRALTGCAVTEVYGSSETGGIAWRVQNAAGNAAWQPMPGVQVRRDAAGQLLVRSPHLPDGQWFECADRATLASDGRFDLLGRADRIVKVEEKRVSLTALEEHLLSSPLVGEVRIVPIEGERLVLGAVVVLTPAGQQMLAAQGKAALNAQLKRHLAPYAEAVVLPRRWRYVAQLPRNTQGKVAQADLVALFDTAPVRPLLPLVKEVVRGAEGVTLTFVVPPDLLYLEGHFPQAPILPGVTQIDWAIHYGREYFPMPPKFLRMEAVKFQQIVRPRSEVTLELTFDAAKGVLAFRVHSAAGPHSQGRVVFSENAP